MELRTGNGVLLTSLFRNVAFQIVTPGRNIELEEIKMSGENQTSLHEYVGNVMDQARLIRDALVTKGSLRFERENPWGPAVSIYGGLALRHAAPQAPYALPGLSVLDDGAQPTQLISYHGNMSGPVTELRMRKTSGIEGRSEIHSLYYVPDGNVIACTFSTAAPRPTEGEIIQSVIVPNKTLIPDMPGVDVAALSYIVSGLHAAQERVLSMTSIIGLGEIVLRPGTFENALKVFDSALLAESSKNTLADNCLAIAS